MQKKQRFIADQRWDLPHYDSMIGFIEDYVQGINKGLITPTNRVVGGWEIIVDSGLTVKVDQSVDSHLLVTERTGFEDLITLLTTDTALTVALVDNTTNYIEVEITSTTSGPQTAAFWDSLADGGEGEEFTQLVDTVDEQIASLISNTTAFSTDANKLPLATITTSGGAVTLITDSRELLWAASTFDFGSPRSDAGISSIRDMYDAITTIIKQDHVKTNWYDAKPALLDYFDFDIIIGNSTQVGDGDATHTIDDWSTAVVDYNRIFVRDGTHIITVTTGNQLITESGLLVEFESDNAVIDVGSYQLEFSGNRNRINLSLLNVGDADFDLSGDYNNVELWIASSGTNPVNDTGTGNTINYRKVS